METINTYYDDYASLEKFVRNNELLVDSNNRAVMVQVFSGICDKNYLLAISKQIRELIPNAQVMGTTTSGEIMNGLVSGLKTVLSFSVFRNSDVRLVFAEKKDKSDYGLGQSIATKLNSDKARVLILFATGFKVNASQLLKGVQSVSANLPVAGGNAGDNRTNTQSFVCGNEKASACGAVGAVLEGDNLTVTCHSHLGWQPIGNEMIITRAEGSRVYTINNIPAYQIYRQYLGITTSSNIFRVIEFPLIICRHGLNIARAPFLRYDDDSIGFFGDIAEGEKVRLSFGHVEMILAKVDALLQIIKQQAVESIFVYSCASRRGFLQESTQIETRPLQNIAPTAGFFTSGEFFHIDGSNQLLNTTMTTLALSESSGNQKISTTEPKEEISNGEAGSEIPVSKDNVADRSIEILRALTCLVDTVTTELNERTAELQIVNQQVQYAGSHDALTGLYNRSYFNQAMKRMEGASTGIIMCDVDGLKFINDSFGHNKGDAILKATADILKALFGPEDVVARIGGDEFSVLLPNSSQVRTEDSCLRIRKAIAVYNGENPTVPLSMSIGYSCHEDESVDINTLLKEADNKMYWEKIYHRQSTNRDLVHTLMGTLEEWDINTKEHSSHLQDLFITLALDSEFPQCNLTDFFNFARFHDIGKVDISDQILFKPGALTPEEKKEMQRHCEIGYRIAQSSTELRPIADWILKHHEWWNGQGYPLGVKGDDIPLECRILAILDAYDDMTSDRPYRQAMSRGAAIEEIRRCAGTQFDPVVVDKFIGRIKKVNVKCNNWSQVFVNEE
ncbi:MAG: FIST N-terminal domain-containing protein [Syntrophomonas sp.]